MSRHDTEQSLAGMAIRDGSILPLTALAPEDFEGRIERLVWTAVGVLSSGGVLPDSMTVADWIQEHHGLSCAVEVGRLTRECPSPANADHYAAKLRADVADAVLIDLAGRLVTGTAADRIADAMATLTELSSTRRKRGGFIRSYMARVVDDLDGVSRMPTVSTGYLDIDRQLGGFHGGDLIVIAARPAMGKTALGVNLIRHAAEKGHVVGMISGEQGGEQIVQRILALKADTSLARMRRQQLGAADWNRIAPALAVVKDWPILIDDLPRPKLSDCIAIARGWKYAHKLELLFVDYLQLVQTTGDGFRLQVGEVAQGLKALARELEIPVVVLAQVKREVEQRSIGNGMGRLPHMGDIAESSIIEQAADQILTLYRPGVYADCERDEGEAWISIAKNRHGPTGMVPLTWMPDSLRFENGTRSDAMTSQPASTPSPTARTTYAVSYAEASSGSRSGS